MVELWINKKKVDIKPDSEVSLDLTNPFLMYDRLPDSKVSVPAIPITPNNRRVMGYVDLPLVLGGFQQYLYDLFYNGQHLKKGFFVLTEAGNGYSGAYTDKNGGFFGDIQTELISNIDFGTAPILPDLSGVAVRFPTIINPDYYGTNATAAGYLGRMNAYGANGYDTSQPIVPMVRLRWLLEAIASKAGVTLAGSYFGSQYDDLLLYNTREIEAANAVTIRQHLPDMTVENFFLELRKLLNLSYRVDAVNKRMTIDFWDEQQANSGVVDWSRKAVLGISKTPELNKRVQLGSELDGSDQLMKDRPTAMADYTTAGIEGNLATLRSKFSTTLMDAGTGLPTVRQVGRSPKYNQLTQSFSGRLLQWEGLQNGMPTATNRGLLWTGPTGLAATRWAKTERLRQNTEYVKQGFNLTAADLAQLNFAKKVHVNGVNYWIINVVVTLPIRKPAQVLLMRA